MYEFPNAPPVPAPEDAPTELVHRGTLAVEAWDAQAAAVTAADVDSDRMVIATDTDLLYFELPDAQDLYAAFENTPALLPTSEQGAVEGAAIGPDGTAVFLLGEGIAPTLWTVECTIDATPSSQWMDCPQQTSGCTSTGSLPQPASRNGHLAPIIGLFLLARIARKER